MHTWLRSFLIGCALATLSALTLLAFLTCTTTGLHALTALTEHLGKGAVRIGAVSGALLGPLHLQDVRYTDGDSAYALATLDLHWDPTRLFSRELRIRRLSATGVRIAPAADSAPKDPRAKTTPPAISLPAKVVIEELDLQPITLVTGKDATTEIRSLTLRQCSFAGSDFRLGELRIALADNLLKLRGTLQTTANYPMQWTVDLDARPPGYHPLILRAVIAGGLDTLTVNADLQSPVAAHLEATVQDALNTALWNIQLISPAVSLRAISQEWPDQHLADVRIAGKGDLDTYALGIQTSANEVHGVKGLTALTADLKGNLAEASLDRLTLTHGPMRMEANGHLRWTPILKWRAELNGVHIDPSLVAADWPADLACTLRTSGEMTSSGVRTSVLLPRLQGRLRGIPLQGQGEVHVDGNRLRIPQLVLTSANSTLRLHGTVAEKADLALALQAPDLSALHAKAHGKLDLQASLAGSAKEPRLQLTLAGSDLGLGVNRIKQATLSAKGELSKQGVIQAQLAVKQARWGGLKLEQAQALLDGGLSGHSFSLAGNGPAFEGRIAAKGRLTEGTWQGVLQETSLVTPQIGAWRQPQPATLTISASQAKLAPFRLLSSEKASLLVTGAWEGASGAWRAHAALEDFPILRINPEREDRPWTLDGHINTTLDASGHAARLLQAKLLAETVNTRLRVHPDGRDRQEFVWNTNTLQADYTNSALHLALHSVLADTSHIQGNLRMRIADPLKTDILKAPMQGGLDIHLKDLSPIFALSEQTLNLSGAIQGQCAITGVPAKPEITGQIDLVRGGAEIPVLGITMEPLQISITGNTDALQLQANAHSGNGKLDITGTLYLDPTGARENVLHLTGSSFTAMQTPGINLDVSPDLTVGFGKEQIDISGEIAIPHAKISSIDVNKSTPCSADVVIIDDDRPDDNPPPVPLRAAVNVIAGDDVLIDAYGLRADITGNLKVMVQPGRPQVGYGTLNLKNGSFTVYSKRLQINMGRLIFSGGPLNNPGIELRSEHKKERTTTGVVIGGTLQRPEISFYSSPEMEQAAIMASLLDNTALGGESRDDLGTAGATLQKVGLGKLVPYLRSLKKFSMIDEIKLETGNEYEDVSLVLGSWVTPDLYVSYGQDMTKATATFNTKFRLGKGFYLLTETGAEQSGGDLQYEFEHR